MELKDMRFTTDKGVRTLEEVTIDIINEANAYIRKKIEEFKTSSYYEARRIKDINALYYYDQEGYIDLKFRDERFYEKYPFEVFEDFYKQLHEFSRYCKKSNDKECLLKLLDDINSDIRSKIINTSIIIHNAPWNDEWNFYKDAIDQIDSRFQEMLQCSNFYNDYSTNIVEAIKNEISANEYIIDKLYQNTFFPRKPTRIVNEPKMIPQEIKSEDIIDVKPLPGTNPPTYVADEIVISYDPLKCKTNQDKDMQLITLEKIMQQPALAFQNHNIITSLQNVFKDSLEHKFTVLQADNKLLRLLCSENDFEVLVEYDGKECRVHKVEI